MRPNTFPVCICCSVIHPATCFTAFDADRIIGLRTNALRSLLCPPCAAVLMFVHAGLENLPNETQHILAEIKHRDEKAQGMCSPLVRPIRLTERISSLFFSVLYPLASVNLLRTRV